jgi:hypothetical protein
MVAHDTYRVHHQPSSLRPLLRGIQLYAVKHRSFPLKQAFTCLVLSRPPFYCARSGDSTSPSAASRCAYGRPEGGLRIGRSSPKCRSDLREVWHPSTGPRVTLVTPKLFRPVSSARRPSRAKIHDLLRPSRILTLSYHSDLRWLSPLTHAVVRRGS